MKNLMVIFLVLAMSMPAMADLNAEYDSHDGAMSVSGAVSIAEAVAAPDDDKFIQLGPTSWIVLSFPDGQAAVPDGTSDADLRIDTFDVPYPADAEVLVSFDGLKWTSVGVYADTANIDLDLKGSRIARYVMIDQNDQYIDPNYPTLGFDLDAVVALNAEVVCIAIKDQILTYPAGHYLEGEVIPADYDAYGYNYHTRMFKGLFANAFLGKAGYPPYNPCEGDESYLAANPDAESTWMWPERNTSLLMKWNDAFLSNEDCDGDGLLDKHRGFDSYIGSGAWRTKVMSGSYMDGEEEIFWNRFLKIVAVPVGAYVGDPSEGEKEDYWYTADANEIGPVICDEFALTQEISNDALLDEHGQQYLSPTYPGVGNQTSEVKGDAKTQTGVDK